MNEPEFDPAAILRVLDRHRVDYVMVGGYAANQHGAGRPTRDIDIAPATGSDNLVRLADALRELCAGIRVDDMPDGLPFDTSAEALAGMSMLNLRTPHGDIDLTFTLAGFPAGYDALIDRATEREVDGITSKSEAGRQKDLQALPELYRLAMQPDQRRSTRGGSARRRPPTT